MVNTFYKDHLEKLIIILISLDFILPIVKPIVKLSIKQKRDFLVKNVLKCVK